MTKAHEIPVGTFAIGLVSLDVMRSPVRRRFGGMRANGREITVYLLGANPLSDNHEDFRQLASHIAEKGLWGDCSYDCAVVVIKRDHRTDDVRLENWWNYKNPVS